MKVYTCLLIALLIGGCASIVPKEVKRETLDSNLAYIRQYSEKPSAREFLICHARYAEVGSTRSILPRVKLDDVIHDLAPPTSRQIIVQVVFSSTSLLRAAGDVAFAIPVKLEAGQFYEFECHRDGENFIISLRNSASGALASPKFQFDAKNPIIVPIPI
jgi:hypothetical protein